MKMKIINKIILWIYNKDLENSQYNKIKDWLKYQKTSEYCLKAKIRRDRFMEKIK